MCGYIRVENFFAWAADAAQAWRRGVETRKSGLHAWENFKHPIHCNHQRSPAGVSQSRKERCAGRLTSGKAVDWDGRAGPGARAAGGSAAGAELGGSAAGAGGAEGSAAGARAGGSSCSRASWNSSPSGSAAAASSGTGPAPSAAALPGAPGAAGAAAAGAPAAGCMRHAACDSLKETCSSPPAHSTTSTASTTSKETLTYVSQLGSLLLWGRAPFLSPSFPSPSLLSFLSCPEPLSQHHYIFSGQPGH